jgi:hypothetical protein
MKRKRGWSREFPTGRGRRFGVDDVPLGLLRQAKAKAKREGVSLRVKILRFLAAWVAEPESQTGHEPMRIQVNIARNDEIVRTD